MQGIALHVELSRNLLRQFSRMPGSLETLRSYGVDPVSVGLGNLLNQENGGHMPYNNKGPSSMGGGNGFGRPAGVLLHGMPNNNSPLSSNPIAGALLNDPVSNGYPTSMNRGNPAPPSRLTSYNIEAPYDAHIHQAYPPRPATNDPYIRGEPYMPENLGVPRGGRFPGRQHELPGVPPSMGNPIYTSKMDTSYGRVDMHGGSSSYYQNGHMPTPSSAHSNAAYPYSSTSGSSLTNSSRSGRLTGNTSGESIDLSVSSFSSRGDMPPKLSTPRLNEWDHNNIAELTDPIPVSQHSSFGYKGVVMNQEYNHWDVHATASTRSMHASIKRATAVAGAVDDEESSALRFSNFTGIVEPNSFFADMRSIGEEKPLEDIEEEVISRMNSQYLHSSSPQQPPPLVDSDCDGRSTGFDPLDALTR